MPKPTGAKSYLRTQVLTAPREKLLLLLFEGAIRFVEQARVHVKAGNYEQSNQLFQKSQQIVLELVAALDPSQMETELLDRLKGLYLFVHGRLVRANLTRESQWSDEALAILRHLHETWSLAVQKSVRETGTLTPPDIRPPSLMTQRTSGQAPKPGPVPSGGFSTEA